MESDLGKLFIGGISWDTDEERLKEYFGSYGEVVEAMIMRDRATGRARGFGFVVFADPAVAERVTRDKHLIDGRSVEAKKAVPREDQQLLNRSSASMNGSPSPGRTKKIFVGGLPSTITESDFKKYFDQFGNIIDVVVMYDHNTQRPRGFGFITYDSEDAVERVLYRTFHDLNGKMVEVKRAVPKELSPGPMRSPLMGYNYGMNRVNDLLNGYAQGYSFNRFNPIVTARGGFPPFGASGHGISMNLDPVLNPNLGGGSNLGNGSGFGRTFRPYYIGNVSRFDNPIGNNTDGQISGSVLSPRSRAVWGNGGLNSAFNPINLGTPLGRGSGSYGVSIGQAGTDWDPSCFSAQGRNFSHGNGNDSYGLEGEGDLRNNGNSRASASSFAASTSNFEDSYRDMYYSGSTWRSANPELDGSGSFGFGITDLASDVTAKSSEGYGSYSNTSRQPNRGIAA